MSENIVFGAVAGQGTQADYWNYETFISLGYTGSTSDAVSC